MIKVFTKIEDVREEWSSIKLNSFLDIDFLNIFYKSHPNIQHLFAVNGNMRLYAHIFKLRFNKTKNYLSGFSIGYIFLRLIRFDVLYLTNSFITNIPSFVSDNKIDLSSLLNKIQCDYSLIIIPDFLFRNLNVQDTNYAKVEVEEEMVLSLKIEWDSFDDYVGDLKKKYRIRIKKIFKKSSELDVRKLGLNDLNYYSSDIKSLFNQVTSHSSFAGPEFNTDIFSLFNNCNIVVYGYFFNDKLVGFSSEIHEQKKFYSYYVGFDRGLNKSLSIYGRILADSIKNAIKLNKEELVFGRTANEFKSNFGAIPIKSFVYLKVRNKYLRVVLKPIYNRLSIKAWKIRSPFKQAILSPKLTEFDSVL